MTQAEKDVLLTIVAELEKIARAVRDLQQNSDTQPTRILTGNCGNLRTAVDALRIG
jgi:hypothetical protein